MAEPVTDNARLFDGRYALLERLGAGGMGSVHLAHDQRLDRDVAIKLLHQHTAPDDVHRARLQVEARLAGSLRHPGIVQVYDYGEEQQSTGMTTPYVVMEHVSGQPLSAVLREQGRLDPAVVTALLASVADALATAHRAGVVHRDLKPSNILVTPAGDPVLVDFGIARSDLDEPLTQTGEIVGTADYLSPEQVRGQRATGASDVYALGVAAYQCLTGTSPFHRESHVATALAHLNDPVPPLPSSVPEPLRSLVGEMLHDDPARRPTAESVAQRATGGDGPPTIAIPAPRRRPRPAAIAIAAALLLVAGLVVAAVTGRDPASTPASADIAVPDVRGDTLAAAQRALRDAGFTVVVKRVDAPRARGRVLAQDPAPGAYAGDEPAEVTLQVASGWVRLDAGDLIGHPYADARAALDDAGLTADRTDLQTADLPAGTVVAVDAGDRVRVGSTVTVTVAVVPHVVRSRAPPPKAQQNDGPKHGPGKPKGHGKKP